MDQHPLLSKCFRTLFIVVMLLLAAELFWYAPQYVALNFQIEDVTRSLETSRQREDKQQYEYDQVVRELPVALSDLEATQPLADAAKAQETELRAQRKALRQEAKDLSAQAEAAAARHEELMSQAESLQAEVDALRREAQELQKQLDALSGVY